MNTMVWLALFFVLMGVLALIFVYVLGRVDKWLVTSHMDKPPSLMRMSADERLDEQRKLITDGARTFPVEFFATVSLNTARVNRESAERVAQRSFGAGVERALRKWFPLGGRIHILPVSSVSGQSSPASSTVRCIAYLESRYAVDAHEVSAEVCRSISESYGGKTDYPNGVTFLPVKMPSPPPKRLSHRVSGKSRARPWIV